MNKPLICIALGVAGVVSIFAHQLNGNSGRQSGSTGRPIPPPTGTWAPLTNQSLPNTDTDYFTPSEMFLMTDGTVLVMAADGSWNPTTGNYFSDPSVWKLTPDINGSYVNGTWSQVASMNHSRLYFGSSVLADGRLLVAGGEYADGSVNTNSPVWSNACEIYDPVANTWTELSPPSGWGYIGDAPCMVLPNGKFLIGYDFGTDTAVFDPATNTWSAGPSIPNVDQDSDEESWALLPNNRVLAVSCDDHPDSLYFDVAGNDWVDIGNLPSDLVDPISKELGPSMLLPNGSVFQMGASALSMDMNGNLLPDSCIYTPSSNAWTLGPPNLSINGGAPMCAPDAPGAVEPNGTALLALSPFEENVYVRSTTMVEYDGTSLTPITTPALASGVEAYQGRFLVLPTGQILYTASGHSDSGGNVYIYTPVGTYQPAWQPTITSVPGTLPQGSSNNALSGTQFNGVSQGSSYGDDSTNFTNYPIVRIQNAATGHVFYCRTHDHSTMGVQTGSATVSTKLDVPQGVETGPSNLYVVANGIPSAPQAVNVVAPHVVLPNGYSLFRGIQSAGSLSSLFYADANVLRLLVGPTLNTIEAPIQTVLTGTSPTLSPTSLTFTVTAKTNTPNVSQAISLWNYSTGKYDVLDTRAISTSNITVTVTASRTLSNYVNASGTVQAKVAYFQTGPTLTYQWAASIDLINWNIQ